MLISDFFPYIFFSISNAFLVFKHTFSCLQCGSETGLRSTVANIIPICKGFCCCCFKYPESPNFKLHFLYPYLLNGARCEIFFFDAAVAVDFYFIFFTQMNMKLISVSQIIHYKYTKGLLVIQLCSNKFYRTTGLLHTTSQ